MIEEATKLFNVWFLTAKNKELKELEFYLRNVSDV